MNFLYPTFLTALVALSIPIIIHLFNFRRFKKVYFTNVRFLKEIKEQKSSRDKLKHLLVLLSRLLALLFLVFAFAQPYIKPTGAEELVQGNKSVSVYIDNSFSMNAQSNDVSLFEKAKRKAKQIAETYSNEDRLQLITNDFEGKHQRLLNKEEFLGYLDEVTVSPNVRQLSEVLNRQQQAFETAETAQNNVFYISDFQKNIVDIENDTSINFYFVPLQSVEQQNVYIDSVWFESPIRMLNQPNKLLVRMHNTGDSNVDNSRLTLRINEQIKALKDVSIKAQQEKIDTINFTITETGWHKAEVNITDYPINFDDTYFFTFEVAEKINVLTINQSGNSPYLNALFKGNDIFSFKSQSVNQLDYTKLPQNQLIILNEIQSLSSGLAAELQQFVREGGSLLIFPAMEMTTATFNNFLKGLQVNTYTEVNTGEREIDYINVQQEVFKDVFEKIPQNLDLPFARRSFEMSHYSSTNEEIILRFRGGSSFLSKYNVGNGKLYMAAANLNIKNSNLPSHAVFVPMVYKIALVASKSGLLAYTIGDNEAIEVDNKIEKKESVFKLRAKAEEFIPGQKILGSKLLISLTNELKEAGVYQLFMEDSDPLAFFGFNFDRQESILEYFKVAELKSMFNFPNFNFIETEELPSTLTALERGVELWKYCIFLVLFFLLVEILLLRLWK